MIADQAVGPDQHGIGEGQGRRPDRRPDDLGDLMVRGVEPIR